MSQVSELLIRSMDLHLQAREVTTGQRANRKVLKERDPEKVRQAYELRKQALALDPGMVDDQWAKAGNHAQMMAFYRDQGLDG